MTLFWTFKIFVVEHKNKMKHHIAIELWKVKYWRKFGVYEYSNDIKKVTLTSFSLPIWPFGLFSQSSILRHIYLILFSPSNPFWLPTCSSVSHRGRKEHFSFQKFSKIFCSIYKGKSQNCLMRDRQLSGIPQNINQQLPFYIAPQWHFHVQFMWGRKSSLHNEK